MDDIEDAVGEDDSFLLLSQSVAENFNIFAWDNFRIRFANTGIKIWIGNIGIKQIQISNSDFGI